MPRSLRAAYLCAAALALAVVTLGAYVRLKDAGLGCPDWPGCYGQLVGVPDEDPQGREIDGAKAWIEVTHRYAAAVLGLAVLAAGAISWRKRAGRALAAALLLLVAVQAGLGALTVTELLKPVIVVLHLLGGMAILALLAAAALPAAAPASPPGTALRVLVAACAVALAAQVALGGWVSANYAGLACGAEFPTCAGEWAPPLDGSAFELGRELGRAADGAPITQKALATVQWAHRLGALVLAAAVAALAAAMWRSGMRAHASLLVALLLTQAAIGIHIVTSLLPLGASLLHNTVAALLCAALARAALAAWPGEVGR